MHGAAIKILDNVTIHNQLAENLLEIMNTVKLVCALFVHTFWTKQHSTLTVPMHGHARLTTYLYKTKSGTCAGRNNGPCVSSMTVILLNVFLSQHSTALYNIKQSVDSETSAH